MFFLYYYFYKQKWCYRGSLHSVEYFLTPITALLNIHLVITFKPNIQLKMKTFFHYCKLPRFYRLAKVDNRLAVRELIRSCTTGCISLIKRYKANKIKCIRDCFVKRCIIISLSQNKNQVSKYELYFSSSDLKVAIAYSFMF